MANVYDNPLYLAEIHENMENFKFLLFKQPVKAYLEIRNAIEVITAKGEYKKELSCGSVTNCSFCCHDRIDMGRVEAEYIKSVIKAKNIIPNKDRIKKQNSLAPVKWIDKACPMLLDENENGQRLCSIYEERPLICRTHNSTQEPEKCKRESLDEVVIRQAHISTLDALSFTSMMLGNGTAIKDPSNTIVAMHQILLDMV